MPIYEYECAACSRTFEEMQKISAEPLQTCSLCRSYKVRRVISRTSFQLKGTGWYVTDYARKGSGEPKGKKDAQAPVSGKKEGETTRTTDGPAPGGSA